ncbi:uncharacterized protein Z519_06243 [Cladophialophora bantiana CBS 173.52]|uniref:Uncharacterized protein n=1 Tax=Cladophialophora bantiana (strain ATCC 10958 / CBS 173.52 / CDC B-1940 / NIH 8579) TaxID=1442370 RepID=A0A0D2HK35_CLAB1|nr:uncharacterized protein Z519_06243 [Cladophialophora bantiana CBS 173.52]KIW93638.1 hypothetical protein Z519_06243 [Cladophialophora bantiana CBS 173.52]
MPAPMNEKSKAVSTETASIQSTSTLSSLKALLHTKDNNKDKPRVQPETVEQKTTRREAAAAYMSMMR